MNDDAIKKLGAATVLQAIEDWRSLCGGATPTPECNFGELEQFFEHDCEAYLFGADVSAEAIYDQLKQERKRSRKLDPATYLPLRKKNTVKRTYSTV